MTQKLLFDKRQAIIVKSKEGYTLKNIDEIKTNDSTNTSLWHIGKIIVERENYDDEKAIKEFSKCYGLDKSQIKLIEGTFEECNKYSFVKSKRVDGKVNKAVNRKRE